MKLLLTTVAALGLMAAAAQAEIKEGAVPAHITMAAMFCKMPGEILRFQQIADQNDDKAFKRLLSYLIAKGECSVINKGTHVVVERLDTDNVAVCVRPRGEPFCGWTSTAFVEPDHPVAEEKF